MKRFHSYGPVDHEEHFFVERESLIEKCTKQLIGNPNKRGHYFTIWAPRQTGKTWVIRQSVDETVLNQISIIKTINNVKVHVVAIGQG